ncbi:MAG: hypothetical protein LBI28_14760 [Treponema sp.]|jgi:hypothetical protein|nr:hypothetical protein [Treponema sp.]
MNEPEWRDANPATEGLPNKGRIIIALIAGGIALAVLTIVGMRVRPVGLIAGVFIFSSGIGMIFRAVKRKVNTNIKNAVIVTASGFLMLLANPRFGVVAGFAAYFLIIGAIGLVVLGLFKAIKLAWDLGKGS